MSEAARSLWLCSQEDGKEAVGGTYNNFGEPILMCACHLEDAANHGTSGVIFDLDEIKRRYADEYGITDDPNLVGKYIDIDWARP